MQVDLVQVMQIMNRGVNITIKVKASWLQSLFPASGNNLRRPICLKLAFECNHRPLETAGQS